MFCFFQKDFIFPADSVKMAQKNYVFGTLFKYLNIYSPIFGARIAHDSSIPHNQHRQDFMKTMSDSV